jgi:hypothetical protein
MVHEIKNNIQYLNDKLDHYLERVICERKDLNFDCPFFNSVNLVVAIFYSILNLF